MDTGGVAMDSRLGLGPVFAVEWRMATRRWRIYAARAGFVGGLLLAMVVVWWGSIAGENLAEMTLAEQAALGQTFYWAIAGTQIALVLLVAPAATAGAICQDKATGTLTHLLVTDLSDAEIVLGKLAARLAPVLGLIGCAVPVLAISTLLGGIDPRALFGVMLATIAVALVGCTLAMLLSVWGRKMHEVLLGTYGVLAIWLLAYPLWVLWQASRWITFSPPYWFTKANPFWLCLTTQSGAVDLTEYVLFLLGCILACVGMAGLSVLTMRAVALRQAGRAQGVKKGWRRSLSARWPWLRWVGFGWIWRAAPRPTLDGNPVLWREWTRTDPSGVSFGVWGLFALAITLGTGTTVYDTIQYNTMGMEIGAIFVPGLTVLLGLMLMGLSAPTSLAEERSQGSLDVLVATPLSAGEILMGKWIGTYRFVLPIALLPTLLTVALALRFGRWHLPFLMLGFVLAAGAAVTSLGLALATWLSRPGRAVGVTLAAYVFVAIGWLILMASLDLRDELGACLALASPFFGPAVISSMIVERGPSVDFRAKLSAWAITWTVLYALAAIALLAAAIRSFDRCMGRIPDFDPEEGPGFSVLVDTGLGYQPGPPPRRVGVPLTEPREG